MNLPSEPPFPASRQREVVAALRAVLPAHCVLFDEEDTRPYECDGLAAYRQLPMVVALPENEAQVLAILNACRALKVPIVPRGAGTGLSGGAMPIADGVVLSTAQASTASSSSIRTRAPPWCSRACATWRFPKRPRRTACITRPIRRRRSPAPSAATSPRIRAACIA